MRIALCDDEQLHIESITKLLDEYRTPDKERVFYDVYENALSLIAAIGKVRYDVILLDIVMPGLSGIEAAKEIRQDNMSIPIVFLTSSPEFAVDSYRVHAFDYLMKPVKQEELYHTLNDIFLFHGARKKDSLTVTFAKGTYVIPFEQLVYLEVSKHNLFFHLADGTCREILGKLLDYEEVLLARNNFIKVHRSYIINMEHMRSYDKKSFTTITGEVIAISRNVASEVQNRYMDYLYTSMCGSNR